MASLVQDVWLGFDPRLRARRLGPWQEPAVRLLFQLDADERIDDPLVAGFLEALAETIEVVAWEPRRHGAPSREDALDAARLVEAFEQAAARAHAFGERPSFVGGRGLGAWTALAAAAAGGAAGLVALSPGRPDAWPVEPPLAEALAEALTTPLTVPVLLLEAREGEAAGANDLSERLAHAPGAARLLAPGGELDLLGPPWPAVIAAWAQAVLAP